MSRNTNPQAMPVASYADAIVRYLSVLEEIYPAAKGATRVVVRPDNHVIVNTPLPTRARERMRLFDQMADVATRLLLETDQYIILSSRD
ncbi:MAG: hypothetical protein QOD33_1555 [Pyrinomonadaceae bacterium]|jgi:hypothetical protein|nr:hypothetical protein [Pyrinomonadaceae bacterium]